jgi:hypothetical protein
MVMTTKTMGIGSRPPMSPMDIAPLHNRLRWQASAYSPDLVNPVPEK